MTTSLITANPACRLACVSALALMASVPAAAETHFHASSTSTAYVANAALFNPEDPLANIVSPWAPFQLAAPGQATATSSNAGFFDGRQVESSAASSLIDGTLKVSAYAIAFPSANSYRGLAAGRAELGDRFLVGAPGAGAFSWTPSSQAHFTILLDGASFSNTVGNQLIFQLGLVITSVTGAKTAGANVTGNLNAAGTQSVSSFVNPANTLPLSLNWSRDASSGDYRITADFNPGGDFDWTLSLLSVAQVNNDFETAFSDYSHTAKLFYAGPDNSTTYSASGAFPGTAGTLPVPEPSSWALMLAGLVAVGQLARRGRVA